MTLAGRVELNFLLFLIYNICILSKRKLSKMIMIIRGGTGVGNTGVWVHIVYSVYSVHRCKYGGGKYIVCVYIYIYIYISAEVLRGWESTGW